MSPYELARLEADMHDPALCLAAKELLYSSGLIGDPNPTFVRPSEYEDKAFGIDMDMITSHGTYKLAFRTCSYLSNNILIRDKEMEKIRVGKYKPDFFIIGVINPADYSLSDVRVISLKDWIAHNKDAIEYNDFGVNRDDPRGNGKSYYLIAPKDKQWQVIYYPMSISGAKRIPYKARGELPSIFLNSMYEEACVLSMCEDFRVEDYLWTL